MHLLNDYLKNPMINIRNIFKENTIFYIVLVTFCIFLVMPQVTIFSQDDKTLRINPYQVAYKGTYIFLVISTFLCAVQITLRKLPNYINQFILIGYKLAAVFIVICVINPVHDNETALPSGISHNLNHLNLTVNLISAFAVIWLKIKYLNYILFGLLVCTFAALTTLNILNMPNFAEKGLNQYLNDKLVEKGIKKPEELHDPVTSIQSNQPPGENEIVLGQKNLIVISFDGVPGPSITKALNNKEYKLMFNDFHYFENVFAHAVSSNSSLFTEIFGHRNWRNVLETEEEMPLYAQDQYKKGYIQYIDHAYLYGLYRQLASPNSQEIKTAFSGHLSIGKAQFNKLLPRIDEKKFIGISGWTEQNKFYDLNKLYINPIDIISISFCRFGFCYIGTKAGIFSNYYEFFKIKILNSSRKSKDFFYIQDDIENLNIQKVKIDKLFKYHFHQLIDYNDFLNLPVKIRFDPNKEKSAFLGHFIFSHWPTLNDEYCNFSLTNHILLPETMDKQAFCILSAIDLISQTLKQKGLYDNSLVIFKSDHGPERLFYTKGGLPSTGIKGHNLLGYMRYRPFVMIKYPQTEENNSANKDLVIHKETFFLGDLSEIYCDFWATVSNCLRDTEMSFDPYFYLPDSKDSSYKFSDKISIKASRNLSENIQIFENISQ